MRSAGLRARWARQTGCMLVALLCGAGMCRAAAPSSPPPRLVVRIPVGSLGFEPPSRFYMPYRMPAATLDFLDATHLLFTFHVAELMHREPGDTDGDQDQTVRALVLSVPQGKTLARTEWRLHDRGRYLWALGDGRFVLRIRSDLLLGGDSLKLQSYLNPEGTLISVQLSPDARTMIAEYSKPAPPAYGDGRPAGAPTLGGDAPRFPSAPPQRYTLLLVDTVTAQAQRVSDLHAAVEMPMVEGGFLSEQQDQGKKWTIQLTSFAGASRQAATVESTCQPSLAPLSEHAFLVENCLPFSDDRLVQAFDLAGHKLWEHVWQSRFTWGSFGYDTTGRRFAYESVEMDHVSGALEPVDPSSILGQPVGVFDIANGDLATVLNADPVLTAGENYALSPDGDELAILRDGAIEIYALPPAPALHSQASSGAPVGARR